MANNRVAANCLYRMFFQMGRRKRKVAYHSHLPYLICLFLLFYGGSELPAFDLLFFSFVFCLVLGSSQRLVLMGRSIVQTRERRSGV